MFGGKGATSVLFPGATGAGVVEALATGATGGGFAGAGAPATAPGVTIGLPVIGSIFGSSVL